MDCTYGIQPFPNREEWIQHLGLKHGLYPEWKSFACPMCHEDTGKGKAAISRHLSSHMEEISLAALPAGVETDDESDSYSDDISSNSSYEWECRACGHAVSRVHVCVEGDDKNIEELSATSDIYIDPQSSRHWDSHKAAIIKLYVAEDMTLTSVRDKMERDYNFKAG